MNKTEKVFDSDLSWENVDKADTVINKTFEDHNIRNGTVRFFISMFPFFDTYYKATSF